MVYVLELRPSSLAGQWRKVRRAVDLVLERPVQDEGQSAKLTDDELAHAVMTSISDQLGWDATSTVGWYAFALPHNDSDEKLIAIQVRLSGAAVMASAAASTQVLENESNNKLLE